FSLIDYWKLESLMANDCALQLVIVDYRPFLYFYHLEAQMHPCCCMLLEAGEYSNLHEEKMGLLWPSSASAYKNMCFYKQILIISFFTCVDQEKHRVEFEYSLITSTTSKNFHHSVLHVAYFVMYFKYRGRYPSIVIQAYIDYNNHTRFIVTMPSGLLNILQFEVHMTKIQKP
ncbi:hypothetical protein ACJX0J_014880, partial [Zea mays]